MKRVKANEGLYDRLRSNFKQLGQMAREYATMQASGGFRSASGTLDRVTKKVRLPDVLLQSSDVCLADAAAGRLLTLHWRLCL